MKRGPLKKLNGALKKTVSASPASTVPPPMDPLQGMIRTESCGPNANQKIVGMVYDVRKRGSVNWGMVISGSQCGNGL